MDGPVTPKDLLFPSHMLPTFLPSYPLALSAKVLRQTDSCFNALSAKLNLRYHSKGQKGLYGTDTPSGSSLGPCLGLPCLRLTPEPPLQAGMIGAATTTAGFQPGLSVTSWSDLADKMIATDITAQPPSMLPAGNLRDYQMHVS